MQYQTAQNPATITSMGDCAPKRNELDGKPERSSRHFLWSTLVVCPSPQSTPPLLPPNPDGPQNPIHRRSPTNPSTVSYLWEEA